MERLIFFSLPESQNIFYMDEKLESQPYCICYQSEVNEYGYGPYDFTTKKAQELIKALFGDTYYWDATKLMTRLNYSIPLGLSFYGDSKIINELEKEAIKFLATKKKNEIFEKLKKPIQKLPEIPLLFDLFAYEKGLFKSASINKLLDRGGKFFIHTVFGPEAGDTYILFNKELIGKIECTANALGIEVVKKESINGLKPW